MVEGSENDDYTAVLKLLIEKRDKVALEIEQCDKAIALLTPLVGRSNGEVPTSKANQYRGFKPYDAALDYMEEKKLEEIEVKELAVAIRARGCYLGKHAAREAANISIAITQNKNAGRKELSLRDGKVVRNLVR